MGDSPLNPLVLIGVGSSFAFSGLFYHLYQEKKKELQKLKEIPLFKPDQHLVKVLKANAHKRLQYVAVEGVVQADGEPLSSRFVPRCFGVIQKIGQEENWKYWNSVTSTWDSRTTKKTETNNSVPFSLVNPESYISDVSVKVHNPLEASGCFMERVYFKVKRAEEGLVDAVLQGLSGEKPGTRNETEELLCVGRTLTGFGEVVLEGDQVMRLQAPKNGRQYVLVPSDHRSFLDRHEASASMWKTLSTVTGITGASLLTGVLYNLFNKQDDRSK
ncbi:mitochondrial ubiquitin ligase activator of nfkb 1-A [Cololabis saira]|uniref:mitochondrial ubiquitin ligase activator of nfkb 1-A n=1 Tax=Cololabis saira TaxID=129043 RepID=UPI002AD1E6E4|nr:mitochondrial ubiquitin ligase activator of nfkb 1-A [Cololabis saira]